ncbi:MAG TPA: crosslink repair DNA glycosylase YcaQ family protein [Anaerolineae bacterium]|nr:crosslink repair DNA glycosylase YcaQ family protein [Anaerolineae bacterium]
MEIRQQQARRFMLAHQGLWPPQQLEGKGGILSHIRRVGSIQYDPLNIVGRNPEIVLQARVADFRPQMLQELLYDDRELLDGWDKMMSIYRVEDWPYFRRRRDAARDHPRRRAEAIIAVLPQVRQAIDEMGPLSSADLKLDDKIDWSWGPTRLARAVLESMYHWGELVIHHKVHARKVYDFASHHIAPDLLSATDPNLEEVDYHDWYVQRRIGAVGLLWGKAGDAWLGMPGIKSKERGAALARLVRQGQVAEVHVEAIGHPFYLRNQDSESLIEAAGSDSPPTQAAILAPLDNLLWDRRLVEELFGFSYRWEVYKPVAERQYGYYVLPILYGDRFVARFEPGRDKESGAVIIKQWWWEPDVVPTEQMRSALHHCFQHFARFLGSEKVRVDVQGTGLSGLSWLATAP